MPKYLLAYHGGGMPETPEEGERIIAAWTAWYTNLGAAVVDPGYPVAFSKTIAEDGSVRDGGGADPVSGYTILEAATIDDAVAMAKGCPILDGKGRIEVAELLPMG
jgi:hypothetical protein